MDETKELKEILASGNVATRIDELKSWLIIQETLSLPRPKTKQAWQALIKALKENTILWKLDFSEELEEEDYAYLHQWVQQNQAITHVNILNFLLHQGQDIAISRPRSKNSALKILFLGSAGSGRKELVVQFPSIDDFYCKQVTLPNQEIMLLQIMDTSGTEQFTAMRDLYMKDGQVFILCFSIIDSSTFSDLADIRDQILRVKDRQDFPILLVGTKADLQEQRVVSLQEARQLAQKWDTSYVECDLQETQDMQMFEKTLLQIITSALFPQPIRQRAESFKKCKETQVQLTLNQRNIEEIEQVRREKEQAQFKLEQQQKHLKLQELLQSPHTIADDIKPFSDFREEILFMATAYNRQDIITYLLEDKHVQVGQEDFQGRTAFHVACEKGNQGMVEFLISKGADIEKKDRENHDAIQIAQQHDHTDLVRFLQEYKKEQALQKLLAQQKGVEVYKRSFAEERQQLHQKLRDICETDPIGQAKQTLWQFLQNTDTQKRQYLQSVLSTLLSKVEYPAKMLRHEGYSATEKLALCVKGSQTLTQKHPMFAQLNQVIKEIQVVQKKLNEHEQYSVVVSCLEKVLEHYNQYISQLSTARAEDKKKDLTRIPVSMTSAAIEPGILKQDIETQLLPYRSITQKDGVARSSHHVVMVQGVHFKQDPHAPGVEYMVASLGNIITNRSTPPTELIKIIDHQGLGSGPIELCYLASKTVQGTDLQHVIEKTPELLSKIRPYSFSAAFVLGLLTDPQDGKPDNYFVEYEVYENGQIRSLNIIGIDNDMAFADPVVKEHRGERKGQHFVNVKNVLYFLPQMQEPVSKTFRKRFLKLSPEIVTLQWLQGLYEKNKEYDALLAQGIFTQTEFEGDGKVNKKGLQLPIKLVPDAATNVYNKLIKMQNYLEQNPDATHEALFNRIEPILQKYYAKIKAEKGGIMACIKEIYAQNASTIEEMVNMESRLASGETSVLTELALQTAEQFGFEEKRYQTIKEATEEFIAHIDYSRFSDTRSMKVLLKTIDEISYIDYANVFYKAINAKTDSIALFDYLYRKGIKSTDSYSGMGTFFHIAASCGADVVFSYMLDHGADIMSRKQSGETALHVAASKGHVEICEILLKRSPALLELTDKLKRSALDRALENGHQGVAQFLVNQGTNTVLDQNRERLQQVSRIASETILELEETHEEISVGKDESLVSRRARSSALQTPPMLKITPRPPVRPSVSPTNQQGSGIFQTGTSSLTTTPTNVSDTLAEVGLFNTKRFTTIASEPSHESEEIVAPDKSSP